MTTFLIIIGILIVVFIAIKFLKVKPKKKTKKENNQKGENIFPPEIMQKYNSLFENGTDQDVIPNGYGEFGHDVTNPIPVNTVAGSLVYLSRLRTMSGEKIKYDRFFLYQHLT
jgi:hypothetical protein